MPQTRWELVDIETRNGVSRGISPVIISASRATDIPAFYPEWFMRRLEAGYVKWINPFSGKPQYVSLERARAIVFWSKYPRPMFRFLDKVEARGLNYYFTFTLNDYESEGIEPCLPSLERRISAFRELSARIGKSRVVWRFDPLVLLRESGVPGLLDKVRKVGDQLCEHTDKLVISFADIGSYKKVKRHLTDVPYQEFDDHTMEQVAVGLQKLNKTWGLQIATCTELKDLSHFGIVKNSCIDGELMVKLFHQDTALMDFLAPTTLTKGDLPIRGLNRRWKDTGQREGCGCIISKDIGRYDTCPYKCRYCYANRDQITVERNYQKHLHNGGLNSDTIVPD